MRSLSVEGVISMVASLLMPSRSEDALAAAQAVAVRPLDTFAKSCALMFILLS